MKQYLDLLRKVKEEGVYRDDRTGTGTYSLFGAQLRFNLSEGFPLVTTKKVHFKSVVHELIWMLKGDTNVKYLNDNGVTIWNNWCNEKGELKKIYGHNWRSWSAADGRSIDQISNVINQIKTNPNSRRLIVSSWNVGEIEECSLPACHTLFQFYVSNGKLSCQLYQRSCDIFLGCPFNIASYALLTHMVAQVCDLEVGDFVHTFGDVHLYSNHLEQAELQLSRDPLPLPTTQLNPDIKNIFNFTYDDIKLLNYKSHETIKAPVAI